MPRRFRVQLFSLAHFRASRTAPQFIQTISLVIVPSIGYGVAKGLQRTNMNASIVSGIIICLATSTTASTNVVFTKLAGGNEALAAMNAIIGNVLGIFLTPAWLVAYLRSSGSINYSAVIELLAITVIAPMVVGNVIQYKAPNKVAWLAARLDFGKVSSVCILLLVWSVFSNTFSKKTTVDAGSVVAMLFVDLFFYAATTAAALLLPLQPRIRSLLHADEEAAIAAAMVAGTKTVALGIPIINACFSGNPHVGLLSLPLICYHAEQILFGSILTGPLHRWVTSVRLKAAAAKQEAAAAAMEEANGGAGGGAGGECSGESGGGEGGGDADGATRVSSHGDADGEASTSPPAEASARV